MGKSAPNVYHSKLKAERREERWYEVEGLLQFKEIKFMMENINYSW